MNNIEDRIEELEFMTKKHHTLILMFLALIVLCLSVCIYLKNKKDMPLIFVAWSCWFMAGMCPGEAESNNIRFLLCITPVLFTIYWFYIKPQNDSISNMTSPKITKRYNVPYTIMINKCENCKKSNVTIKNKKNKENKENNENKKNKEDKENREDQENKEENKQIDETYKNSDNNSIKDDVKNNNVSVNDDKENVNIVKLF